MDNKEVFARYRGRIIGIFAAILFSLLYFFCRTLSRNNRFHLLIHRLHTRKMV